MNKTLARAAAWIVVVSFALAACGGGGGGGAPTSTSSGTAPPPVTSTPTTPTTPTSPNTPTTPTPTTPTPPPPASLGEVSVSAASLVLSANANEFVQPKKTLTFTLAGTKAADVEVLFSSAPGALIGFGPYVPNEAGFAMDIVGMLPITLLPGSHAVTLTFRVCVRATGCTRELTGSPVSVAATYEIIGSRAQPSFTKLELREGTKPEELSVDLRVHSHPGAAWTAQANRPWLRLSRTSSAANDPSPLTVTIDESLQRLANGVHDAQVLFSTDSGVATATISLDVQRTQVNAVAPQLISLFDTTEVIIRGALFDAATITGVQFGNVDASSFRIVSPSEIRAQPSNALPAGNHVVALKGAASGAISQATLTIANPSAYSAQRIVPSGSMLPYGEPVDIVYDAVRKQINVAVDRPANSKDYVARFVSQDASTWTASVLYQGRGTIRAMASAADGKHMLLSEDGFTVESDGFQIPAIGVSFVQNLESAIWFHYDGWTSNFIQDLAVANDGHVIHVAGNTETQRRGIFRSANTKTATESNRELVAVQTADNSAANVFVHGVAGASRDGSRILFGDATSGSMLYEYDASASSLTRTPHALAATDIQLDRTGERVVLNHRDVYDRAFQLLWQLPPNTRAAVFSPNGTSLYTYDSDGNINNFDVATQSLIRSRVAIGSPGEPTKRVVMAISHDNATLFIAGSEAVLVEPVPLF